MQLVMAAWVMLYCACDWWIVPDRASVGWSLFAAVAAIDALIYGFRRGWAGWE